MKKAFLYIFLALVLPAAGILQAKPNQVVIGYSATWFDDKCPPEYYNYDAMTYLARSFLTPRPDGGITVPGNFFDTKMEDMARQHGVKLLMSLGGEQPDANNWLSVARHPEYLDRFFGEVEKLLKDHNYDGVDIDWEPSALTLEDGKAYCDFMKALRARFPNITITTALGTGDYWISHFPSWPDIINSVDYINAMTYVYSGSWGGVAGHDSPLYPAGVYKSDAGLSANEGLQNMVGHYKVPRAKLLVGLDFWGDQFNAAHMGDTFPKDQTGQGGEISFPDVMQLMLTGAYNEKWDPKAEVPYLERKDPGHVVSYENERSIQAKCEYARQMHYGGVMVWHVGSDVWGNRAPLMDTVAKACGAAPQTFTKDFLLKQVGDLNGQIDDRKGYLDQMNQILSASGTKTTPAPWAGAYSPSALAQLSNEEIEKTRLNFEKALGTIQGLIAKAQVSFLKASIPKGKALDPSKPLLLDDFETGKTLNRLGTQWSVDFDHNNLGTDIKDADSFVVRKGARKSKYCARIYGHYGRSAAPWPWATLSCALDPSGQAVDLSGFKAIQFMVKGDGKKYEIVLDNPKVLDFANFRSEFTATKGWTQVTLTLDSFHQPDWGAQVNRDMGAVKKITFEPSGMSDEDFDLSIDNITFIP